VLPVNLFGHDTKITAAVEGERKSHRRFGRRSRRTRRGGRGRRGRRRDLGKRRHARKEQDCGKLDEIPHSHGQNSSKVRFVSFTSELRGSSKKSRQKAEGRRQSVKD